MDKKVYEDILFIVTQFSTDKMLLVDLYEKNASINTFQLYNAPKI